jgi:Fe2+ or Zn2+ uptake regulation protein
MPLVSPARNYKVSSCESVASSVNLSMLTGTTDCCQGIAQDFVAALLRPVATPGAPDCMPLPQTEIPGRLQAYFSERGIRITQQRRAVLRVIETATKHLDASQILRKVQRVDASVDRSTVYRTLQLLKRHGLVDELDLLHIRGEGHYYERKMNREHIHIACLRCGKITEFVSATYEKLKQQVEKDCQFKILVSRLEVGGYCSACRQ